MKQDPNARSGWWGIGNDRMQSVTDNQQRIQRLATIAFFAVSIAWGTTYGGMRVAVQTIPPFLMGGIRFVAAGLAMMIAFRLWGIPFPTARDWKRIIPVGILLLSCANSLVAWSEQYIDSAFAALMINTGPFIFVGLSAFLGERVPKLAWTGLCVGFLGVVLLILPDLRELISSGLHMENENTVWAIGALLLGPVCWSVGSVYANKRPPACNQLMSAAGQTTVGGIGAFFLALLHGDFARPFAPSLHSLLAVGYLIVVGSWLGYVCYMYCVMHLPARKVALVSYLNVVVAMAVGVAFLGEKITLNMVIGGAVILLGVFIVNRSKQPKTAS